MDLIKSMGGKVVNVGRASLVEWDKNLGGWTVVAPDDVNLCLRTDPNGSVVLSREGKVAVFGRREEALKLERQFFWQLLGE